MPKLKAHFVKHGKFELPRKKTMKKWMKAAIERDTELNIVFVDAEGNIIGRKVAEEDIETLLDEYLR